MTEELLETTAFSILSTDDTEYSADSVEWCPHEPHQNVFVCGTYQLKENAGQTGPCERLGRILLYSITSECCELKLHQKIETAAILDQKWCHNLIKQVSILGVVNAKGGLVIYKLNSDNIRLEEVTKYQFDDSELLILSLDWSTGKYETEEPDIICSDSKGSIHIFGLTNNKLVLKSSVCGHGFEAWIAQFYYWDPNIYFSGL